MDIHAHDGGLDVGWNRQGEYLRYTIDVTEDGTIYSIALFRFSAVTARERVSCIINAWLSGRLSTTVAVIYGFASLTSRHMPGTMPARRTHMSASSRCLLKMVMPRPV